METLHDQYVKTNSRFNNDISLIMQALINFYGEQHKEYILERLSNSRIIWYDDKEFDENDDIHNHIISSLSVEEINELLKKRSEKAFLQSAYIDEFDLLVLPLSYDLTDIIHEINHKISSHLITVEPLKQISGISYSVEIVDGGVVGFDVNLNEAVNQKMTLEILTELQKLGIKVKVAPSWQEHLFPLINLFYDTFKDLLKEVNITGDLVSLRKILGEENYNEFSQLISMLGFRIRRMIKNGERIDIFSEKIAIVENLVSEMKAHYERFDDEIKRSK